MRLAIPGGGKLLLLALPLLAACTGGAGPIPGGDFGYESANASGDRRPGTGEAPPDSTDAPTPSGGGAGGGGAVPGAGGGSGNATFTCEGTYHCSTVVQGRPFDVDVVLSKASGDCTGSGGEDGDVILTDDGRIVQGGQEQGTWAEQGDGFTITNEGVTLTCTKK